MKYRKIDLIIEIALCCFPLLLFGGCFYLALSQAADSEHQVTSKHSSVVFDFKNLWNMQFPEEFTSTYIFYNRGGWMGEGFFYAVYECEQPNEEFFTDFTADLNEEVKNNINSCFESFDRHAEHYEIQLDRTYLPDFDSDFISVSYHGTQAGKPVYIGKDNCLEYCDDHLYMCYFQSTKTLYIYENIT